MVQIIKAGEGIIAANASGNRDEEVFSNPDVFDMHRTPDPNHALGFGFGPHRCVAEPLARAEMELVFGKQAFLDIFCRTPSSGRSCNFLVPRFRQILSVSLFHGTVPRGVAVKHVTQMTDTSHQRLSSKDCQGLRSLFQFPSWSSRPFTRMSAL